MTFSTPSRQVLLMDLSCPSGQSWIPPWGSSPLRGQTFLDPVLGVSPQVRCWVYTLDPSRLLPLWSGPGSAPEPPELRPFLSFALPELHPTLRPQSVSHHSM